MNLVILKGRFTKDMELKTSSNGTNYLNNSIAVDRRFSKGDKKEADFFSISAFGKTAEFINKYFHKGSAVLIKGRIENNIVEKDGHKTTYTTVMVEEVDFCESKGDGSNNSTSGGSDDFLKVPEGLVETLDLPF